MHCMNILNGGSGNMRPTGSLDELVAALEATLDLVRSLRDRSVGLTPRDSDSDNSHQPRQA